MGFKDKFKSFFEFDEYEEVEEATHSERPHSEERAVQQSKQNKDNIVSLSSVQNDAKMVLCEPTEYDETQNMADYLKKRQSIVVNLQRLDTQTGRRVVDFLSGTVYALNGNIQKLGQQTFLCTPEHVNISGNITELFDEEEQFRR
ncbi:cell division protein SepF [Aquisalibacillus elongatus]|uniref:Cell division protein SepF n=1 Tax=Aquisalibacillus elongatus TaxID=485577 RepID=A0A3N5C1V7_9BACI|nr:cell division protein SepF [Aquisalibacillus elongatus]RPF56068.1 cell division inhibitor SepF [Aquisalibacillus elongatus]